MMTLSNQALILFQVILMSATINHDTFVQVTTLNIYPVVLVIESTIVLQQRPLAHHTWLRSPCYRHVSDPHCSHFGR
jgi:hypothetical protein